MEQVEARLWEFQILDEQLMDLIQAFETDPTVTAIGAAPPQVQERCTAMALGISDYREARQKLLLGSVDITRFIHAPEFESTESQGIVFTVVSALETALAQFGPMRMVLTKFVDALRAFRGAEPYVFAAPSSPVLPSSPPKYTSFRYTKHARERMAQRRISENQVEKAINQPDRLTQQSDGSWVAERDTSAGNFIRAVYAEELSGLKIVTAAVITVMRITP